MTEICHIEREFLLHQEIFRFSWQRLSLKLWRILFQYVACSNETAVSRTDITISSVKLIWDVTKHRYIY